MTPEEVWKFAQSIHLSPSDGGLGQKTFADMFGGLRRRDVFHMSLAEIESVLADYGKKLSIGDVVESGDSVAVVVGDYGDMYKLLATDGEVTMLYTADVSSVRKLGHTDKYDVLVRELEKF